MRVDRSDWLVLGFLVAILSPAVAHAQPWSGIISRSRAMAWAEAGLPACVTAASWMSVKLKDCLVRRRLPRSRTLKWSSPALVTA